MSTLDVSAPAQQSVAMRREPTSQVSYYLLIDSIVCGSQKATTERNPVHLWAAGVEVSETNNRFVIIVL